MADGRKKPEAGDAELFRQVMSDVKPLKQRKPRAAPPPPEAAAKPPPKAEKRGKPGKPTVVAPPPPAPAKPKAAALSHGDISAVDRRSGQRLKRGQMAVEARIDLHGMTQAEAHRALDAFLAGQQAAGRRCVLVVTGKGVGREGGGVLRAAVPRWLNEAPNRERVLAFEYARQKDGGQAQVVVPGHGHAYAGQPGKARLRKQKARAVAPVDVDAAIDHRGARHGAGADPVFFPVVQKRPDHLRRHFIERNHDN